MMPRRQPHIGDKLRTIEKVSTVVAGRSAVVTSVRDGKHMKGSLHYKGKAIDLRTRDPKREAKAKLTEELQRRLGKDYDVIFEPTKGERTERIHLEYDPKPRPRRTKPAASRKR